MSGTAEVTWAGRTAAEIAAAVRARDVSPVEVVDDCLAAIAQRNPALNAIVHVAAGEARAAARAAERTVLAGEPLGALHGVPVIGKDLFGVKPGWPATHGGIPALRDRRSTAPSIFAERIEAAGAIVVGSGNSPIMGMRGTCDNPLYGPTRNPFDLDRNSGGSSGGGAAAVAAGIVPIAEGTDGGGSVRIPASWCGVYGFKATYGRVPYCGRPNAFAGLDPFLFRGPITRTVGDAALALAALCGPDPRDPHCLLDDFDPLAALPGSLEGTRIAYSPALDVFPVDPRVAEVVERAVGRLAEAGAHVEQVELGLKADQRELSELWFELILPMNLQVFEVLKREGVDVLGDHADQLPERYRERLAAAATRTTLDRMRAQELRTAVYDAIERVFAQFDLLASPTLSCLPVPNAADGATEGPSEVAGIPVDPLIGWCPTYLLNFTGHPAASLPAGFAEGLPVGLQLAARRGADAHLLAASAAFEQIEPWDWTYRGTVV